MWGSLLGVEVLDERKTQKVEKEVWMVHLPPGGKKKADFLKDGNFQFDLIDLK